MTDDLPFQFRLIGKARRAEAWVMRCFAELNEAGDRIDVYFKYSPDAVAAVKRVPGARFVPLDKGGPLWRLPLDLVSGERLREEFGMGLEIGEGLRSWGRAERRKERNLKSLTSASDAELSIVPSRADRIARAIAGEPLTELSLPPGPDGKPHPLMTKRDPRPYQRADIAMMAQTNTLNANQMGTGKTLEWLGAVVEADLFQPGSIHLVCAPVRSLENVWLEEIDRFLPDAWVYTAEDLAEREYEVNEALTEHATVKDHPPMFICLNPDFIRVKKVPEPPDEFYAEDYAEWDMKWSGAEVCHRDRKGNIYTYRSELQKRLLKTEFATFNIDEFHKAGLGNPDSLFRISVGLVKAQKRCAMSGTPMGGKPIKLFPILQWLEPQSYTSKWRWAEQWLVIDDNGFGKDILGIQPGREDQFYEAHAKHMVRRLKREALPGLPEKTIIDVACSMTPKQSKQYEAFQRDAEIRIEEQRLSATNVLAEYARLKQFANATCTLETRTKRNGDEEIIVTPTPDSGKVQDLLEKLDNEGIRKTDPEPRARAIVASESKRMVDMLVPVLRKAGIHCDALTGETKDSRSILKKFKEGDERPYVIVMTTTTGGVSLNLEEAGSIHILDETWNPDDQEQLEDRGDRGSRTESLRVYYYRTRGTIQQYIAEVTQGKAVTNKNILDIRRLLRQKMEEV
jgi:hypothetical protein